MAFPGFTGPGREFPLQWAQIFDPTGFVEPVSNRKWVIFVSVADGVSTWARFAGMTLRPWSGTSPASLIGRGLVSLVISGVLAYFFLQILSPQSGIAGMASDELAFLESALVPAIIVAALMGLYAVARIVVGIIDFVPRRTVHGTVVSLRQRRVGDFLPRFLQHRIFGRGQHVGHDRRRTRTELVLSTAEGTRSWTLRDQRLASRLAVGRPVTIRVSPLAGYVAEAQQH